MSSIWRLGLAFLWPSLHWVAFPRSFSWLTKGWIKARIIERRSMLITRRWNKRKRSSNRRKTSVSFWCWVIPDRSLPSMTFFQTLLLESPTPSDLRHDEINKAPLMPSKPQISQLVVRYGTSHPTRLFVLLFPNTKSQDRRKKERTKARKISPSWLKEKEKVWYLSIYLWGSTAASLE